MNREEVLKKARNELAGSEDELEYSVRRSASSLAFIVGAQLCIFFLFTHRARYGSYDPVPAAIYFAMSASHLIYRGAKLKQTRLLIGGIVIAVIALALCGVYVFSLLKS